MDHTDDERVKQVAVGAGILILIGVIVPSTLVGWRYLPGLLGETVGTIIGVMTTPFCMEATFVVLGITIVIALNNWRRFKDGDDFVYLEQIDGPDAPGDLPDQARWAVYREKPLDPVAPTLLEQAEGAFAIGDYGAAVEWIGAMERAELMQQDTLSLRLQLARATGKTELIELLINEIVNSKPNAS
ncbi:MAG: hypothetical protein ABI600_12140 [Luteolibacter sp.]